MMTIMRCALEKNKIIRERIIQERNNNTNYKTNIRSDTIFNNISELINYNTNNNNNNNNMNMNNYYTNTIINNE